MDSHPLKQRFVLDTSVFLCDENRREGESLDESVARLLDAIAEAKLTLNISCYVPPSIHEELTRMLRDRGVSEETLRKLNTWLIRKNPAYTEVMIPAQVVYDFIDEMSERINRGLRVSEEAVRAAGNGHGGDDEGSDGLTQGDRVISELRSKYRDALRRGVLDSQEDFDLLVLARELNAGVVTEDAGIVSWAEDFGLRYMRGQEFPHLLAEYLDATERLGEREGEAMDEDSDGAANDPDGAANDPGAPADQESDST